MVNIKLNAKNVKNLANKHSNFWFNQEGLLNELDSELETCKRLRQRGKIIRLQGTKKKKAKQDAIRKIVVDGGWKEELWN